jgi:hypothetical protein
MINQDLFGAVFGDTLNQRVTLSRAIEILDELSLINIGELAEQAISIKSKIALCSKNTPEIDLVSGKQIKHGRTNPGTQHAGLKAFCSIKNHTSTILFVATETYSKKEYYFVFPYSSYGYYSGNTICVPFDWDGTPIRSNKWWSYEVGSFERLCECAA